MPVTSIDSVVVDKEEYSKFEPVNAVIEVRVLVTGDNDTLTVELRKARRSRIVAVATTTISVPVAHDSAVPLYATIDTRTAAIQSPELYNLIRRGQYFIHIETTSVISTTVSVLAAINDVTLSVVASGAFPATGEIRINDGAATEETVAYSANVANVFTLVSGLQQPHIIGESVDLHNVIGISQDFGINIITAQGMRSTYLFGIDLQSSDIRMPKFQPRQITGVEITEVSRAHKLSFFPLNFKLENGGLSKFLSWDNGELIAITPDYKSYLLPATTNSGAAGAEFVAVEVDYYRLPAVSIQEILLIDEFEITDDMIRENVLRATDYIEFTQLQVYLEPTQLVTDIDVNEITYTGDGNTVVINTDYDFITTPASFFPRKAGQWISIQFPFVKPISVTEVFGAVANTRVVHINTEWVEFSSESGFTQLVPFNSELAFDFVGLIWVESLHSAAPIPNFWHYNVVAGLRECTGDIRELISKSAAIPTLTVAGQAFRGGFSSQSVSRDGISESVSYTSSAIYGIYSATTEEFKNWIRENLPTIRRKHRGPLLMVL